ncbi:hypothetical protein BJ742DRAFT_859865 [Cladochytrium replicatum]|nr:hypothetical protein BJ742DRAFT_859865 [Cladochytrium replicatum]
MGSSASVIQGPTGPPGEVSLELPSHSGAGLELAKLVLSHSMEASPPQQLAISEHLAMKWEDSTCADIYAHTVVRRQLSDRYTPVSSRQKAVKDTIVNAITVELGHARQGSGASTVTVPRVIVVEGTSGSGKSVMIASIVKDILSKCAQRRAGSTEGQSIVADNFMTIICRNVGTTPRSSTAGALVASICQQLILSQLCNHQHGSDLERSMSLCGNEVLVERDSDVGVLLKENLSLFFQNGQNRENTVLMVIDGLDRLPSADQDLRWLLPVLSEPFPGLQILVSTAPSTVSLSGQAIRSSIVGISNLWITLEVLSPTDFPTLIQYLSREGTSDNPELKGKAKSSSKVDLNETGFAPQYRDLVKEAAELAIEMNSLTPLLLKLLYDTRAHPPKRTGASGNGLEVYVDYLPATTPEAVERLCDMVETKLDAKMVVIAMILLSIARDGLTGLELSDLIVAAVTKKSGHSISPPKPDEVKNFVDRFFGLLSDYLLKTPLNDRLMPGSATPDASHFLRSWNCKIVKEAVMFRYLGLLQEENGSDPDDEQSWICRPKSNVGEHGAVVFALYADVLVDYFSSKSLNVPPLVASPPQFDGKKIRELSRALRLAGRWDDLYSTFTDLQFIQGLILHEDGGYEACIQEITCTLNALRFAVARSNSDQQKLHDMIEGVEWMGSFVSAAGLRLQGSMTESSNQQIAMWIQEATSYSLQSNSDKFKAFWKYALNKFRSTHSDATGWILSFFGETERGWEPQLSTLVTRENKLPCLSTLAIEGAAQIAPRQILPANQSIVVLMEDNSVVAWDCSAHVLWRNLCSDQVDLACLSGDGNFLGQYVASRNQISILGARSGKLLISIPLQNKVHSMALMESETSASISPTQDGNHQVHSRILAVYASYHFGHLLVWRFPTHPTGANQQDVISPQLLILDSKTPQGKESMDDSKVGGFHLCEERRSLLWWSAKNGEAGSSLLYACFSADGTRMNEKWHVYVNHTIINAPKEAVTKDRPFLIESVSCSPRSSQIVVAGSWPSTSESGRNTSPDCGYILCFDLQKGSAGPSIKVSKRDIGTAIKSAPPSRKPAHFFSNILTTWDARRVIASTLDGRIVVVAIQPSRLEITHEYEASMFSPVVFGLTRTGREKIVLYPSCFSFAAGRNDLLGSCITTWLLSDILCYSRTLMSQEEQSNHTVHIAFGLPTLKAKAGSLLKKGCISAAYPSRVIVVDIETGQNVCMLEIPATSPKLVHPASPGSQSPVPSSPATARPTNQSPPPQGNSPQDPIFWVDVSLARSPPSAVFATHSGRICVNSIQNPSKLLLDAKLPFSHQHAVDEAYKLVLFNSGTSLLVAECSHITALDLVSGNARWTVPSTHGNTTSSDPPHLAIHPEDKWIVHAHTSGRIEVRNPKTGIVIYVVAEDLFSGLPPSPIKARTLTAGTDIDSSRVVVSDSSGLAYIVSIDPPGKGAVLPLTLNPTSGQGTVLVWKCRRFTEDPQRLFGLSVSRDGTVRLWDGSGQWPRILGETSMFADRPPLREDGILRSAFADIRSIYDSTTSSNVGLKLVFLVGGMTTSGRVVARQFNASVLSI